MEELKLTRPPKIKVILDEKEYLLTKPRVESAMHFTSALAKTQKDGDSNDGVKLMRNMIISCGLPEAVTDSLELELLEAVGDALMPKKKS